MDFDAVRQRLSSFGDVAVSRNGNQILFSFETTIEGAHTVEELGMVVGDIPTASLVVTGNGSGDALVIVKVDYDEISLVPPYLQKES